MYACVHAWVCGVYARVCARAYGCVCACVFECTWYVRMYAHVRIYMRLIAILEIFLFSWLALLLGLIKIAVRPTPFFLPAVQPPRGKHVQYARPHRRKPPAISERRRVRPRSCRLRGPVGGARHGGGGGWPWRVLIISGMLLMHNRSVVAYPSVRKYSVLSIVGVSVLSLIHI